MTEHLTRSKTMPEAPVWPTITLDQAEAVLTAPGARFEMEVRPIRGVATRVWKNALPTLTNLVELARDHGDRTFLIYEDERVSHLAFHKAVATLAERLGEMGVAKGDRVALAMRNLPEWPVAFFAAAVRGAIVTPLNAWWTSDELQYGMADAGAKVLICDAERFDRLKDRRDALPALEHVIVSRADAPIDALRLEDLIGAPEVWGRLPDLALPTVDLAADDEATLFYTSGTTGAPKGAIGTHRNLLTNPLTSAYSAARSALRRGQTPPAATARTTLLVIPLFHVTACSATLIGALGTGSTLVFMHKWDVLKALALIERERINVAGGVPTIAWQLLEHPERDRFDLSSLDTVNYGGAPAAPELVRKIKAELNATPSSGWGMTETTATVTHHAAEDYLNRPDSCGPAAPVAQLKIMADDGVTEQSPGEVGELWCKGPQVVKGYWNKPEATAQTFVDGWVRTGDLARLDDEGFCYIVDRAKDIVIRGGENIYSSEVENVLFQHPAVTDAALIGLPHRTLGEEPAAVVHLAPGANATEAELQAFVRERLAAFKTPVRIVFQSETLPRNANGKILKAQLRDLF